MLIPFLSVAARHRWAVLAGVALLAATRPTLAQQGVTIGASTAPDVSAALDIVSSSKGALLPRVASAAALATPATGLIVFQTGSPAGFYYNAGTPAAPSWQQLATAADAAFTASNGLTKTGNDLALGGTLTQNTTLVSGGFNLALTGTGRLGVGLGAPAYPLDVAGDLNSSTMLRLGGAAMVYQTGSSNYFLGTNTVPTAPTGTLNLMLGARSGSALTSGSYNVGVGQWAGESLTQGNFNVFMGIRAGQATTVGGDNVYIGRDVGAFSVNGAHNVGVGSEALQLVTGNDNTALGNYAGAVVKAGVGNTFVGSLADLTNNSGSVVQRSRATALGYNAKVDQDDAVVLGDPANAAVRVGIGTTQPSQKLDVNGTARLRGLTTAGVVTTDASGTLGSATAASLDATTASNGLTKTGQNVALGGTLTQATTLTQAGNSLTVVGTGSALQQISQPIADAIATDTNPGQSFQLPAGVTVTRVDVYGRGGTGTFTFYQGNPGGTVLGTPQSVGYNAGPAPTSVFLSPPVTIATAGTYSFSTGSPNFSCTLSDVYSDGSYFYGTHAVPSVELTFTVHYTTTSTVPALCVAPNASVGIGTSAPTATLDVAGTVRARGLGLGVVMADVDGTLSSSRGAGSFILNQTTAIQTGGFRLDGSGAVGGVLGVGTATPDYQLEVATTGSNQGIVTSNTTGATSQAIGLLSNGSGPYLAFANASLNPVSGYSAYIEQFPTGGTTNSYLSYVNKAGNVHAFTTEASSGVRVGIGTTAPMATLDVAGAARVRGLTMAGVVTTDALGNLGSGDGSGSFVLNQTATDQAGGFRVSGNGLVGGAVRVGQAGAPGQVLTPTTGNSNMLAVAYGSLGGSGTALYSSSGNFTVSRPTAPTAGRYIITFSAASGLSTVNFANNPVTVTVYNGGTAGLATFTGGTGTIMVYTYSLAGGTPAPADFFFSFAAFAP